MKDCRKNKEYKKLRKAMRMSATGPKLAVKMLICEPCLIYDCQPYINEEVRANLEQDFTKYYRDISIFPEYLHELGLLGLSQVNGFRQSLFGKFEIYYKETITRQKIEVRERNNRRKTARQLLRSLPKGLSLEDTETYISQIKLTDYERAIHDLLLLRQYGDGWREAAMKAAIVLDKPKTANAQSSYNGTKAEDIIIDVCEEYDLECEWHGVYEEKTWDVGIINKEYTIELLTEVKSQNTTGSADKKLFADLLTIKKLQNRCPDQLFINNGQTVH